MTSFTMRCASSKSPYCIMRWRKRTITKSKRPRCCTLAIRRSTASCESTTCYETSAACLSYLHSPTQPKVEIIAMCGLLQSYLLQRREWVHLQRVDGVLCHPRPYAHEG